LIAAIALIFHCPRTSQRALNKKVSRIGFLSASSSIDPAFLEGLCDRGYADKKKLKSYCHRASIHRKNASQALRLSSSYAAPHGDVMSMLRNSVDISTLAAAIDI